MLKACIFTQSYTYLLSHVFFLFLICYLVYSYITTFATQQETRPMAKGVWLSRAVSSLHRHRELLVFRWNGEVHFARCAFGINKKNKSDSSSLCDFLYPPCAGAPATKCTSVCCYRPLTLLIPQNCCSAAFSLIETNCFTVGITVYYSTFRMRILFLNPTILP